MCLQFRQGILIWLLGHGASDARVWYSLDQGTMLLSSLDLNENSGQCAKQWWMDGWEVQGWIQMTSLWNPAALRPGHPPEG